jgi:hypothetical protein
MIDDNDEHPLKQLEPIAITWLGNIIDDNDEHSQNNWNQLQLHDLEIL